MVAPIQTSTLNENLKMAEQINIALYKNLYLLSLKFPMSDGLKNHMKEDILKVPNSTAFFQVAYYLMSVIDKKYITSDLIYVFHDPKMSTQFRKQFLTFVNDMEKKHSGYISPIMASWLVTAGGYKIVKLLFQLTQVALHVQIAKSKQLKDKIPDIKTASVDTLDEYLLIIQKELYKKVSEDYVRSQNMEKMAQIYREEIHQLETDITRETVTLNEFVNKLSEKSNSIDNSNLKELSNTLSCPSLLTEWENHIKDKIENVEATWDNVSKSVGVKIQATKSTSEETIQLYTQRSNKSNTLEYSPGHNRILTGNIKDGTFDEPIFKNIVNGDVLHLPNLFKAYNVILAQYIQILKSLKLNDKYCIEVKDKSEKFKDIETLLEESKVSLVRLQSITENLKTVNFQQQHTINPDDEWILEVVNIPSISD